MLQVVIPMAGIGSRFSSFGFTINKFLLPMNEKQSMIEVAVQSLDIKCSNTFVYVVREQIPFLLDGKMVYIDELTDGPASTVMKAQHVLDPEHPLLVSNSDQVLDWNSDDFFRTCEKYDGCVLTYTPEYKLTIGSVDKHSFVRFENEKVVECREKIVLSDNALVGVHYFKKAQMFFDGYAEMIKKNIRAPNGEFYLSLVYQALIESGYSIGVHKLGTNEKFYPVGEPYDYFNYLYTCGRYKDPNVKNLTEHVKIIRSERGQKIKSHGLLLVDNLLTTRDVISDGSVVFSIDCNVPKQGEWGVHSFTRGWFMGDFEPSIVRTKEFEVGKLIHKKDEKWPFHYHKNITEVNYLIKGSMRINGRLLYPGDIFTFMPGQIACPQFIEDCEVLCVKTPSVPSDKYII